MSEWIEVSNGLPSKQVDVVFYAKPYEFWCGLFTPDNDVLMNPGFHYHQHWGDDCYHKVEGVTHYMILPDPKL